jgi:peroxiredoxin
LRAEYGRFVDKGAEVLAVGPEGPHRFRQVWEEQRFPFVGLADPRHTVENRYGQEVIPAKFGRMPALMVIDKQGVIRYAHFGEDMSDIPKNANMLALLDELRAEEEALREDST